jgi:hypothetical protein
VSVTDRSIVVDCRRPRRSQRREEPVRRLPPRYVGVSELMRAAYFAVNVARVARHELVVKSPTVVLRRLRG